MITKIIIKDDKKQKVLHLIYEKGKYIVKDMDGTYKFEIVDEDNNKILCTY